MLHSAYTCKFQLLRIVVQGVIAFFSKGPFKLSLKNWVSKNYALEFLRLFYSCNFSFFKPINDKIVFSTLFSIQVLIVYQRDSTAQT